MVTADELRRLKGERVTLQLAPEAGGLPSVTGRIASTIEAADGLVVVVEREGPQPGKRLNVHYHHIRSVTKT